MADLVDVDIEDTKVVRILLQKITVATVLEIARKEK